MYYIDHILGHKKIVSINLEIQIIQNMFFDKNRIKFKIISWQNLQYFET